jgi:hypothetical protein
MILVPRTTVFGSVLPTNSTGTPRPLLVSERPYLTIHYTGAGLWLDPDDTPTELRAIQAYAKSAGKPWEYNWVVDGQGIVWEYAGDYRAAHSQGDNEVAIGVLLLVGLDQAVPPHLEEPPPSMIQAVRELRQWLVTTDRLAADHQMKQHNQMPGANTSCPGARVIAHWAEFTAPVAPIPPEDDMPAVFYRNSESRMWDNVTYPAGQIKYLLLETGKCRRISGDELADRGYPSVDINFGIAKTNAYLNAIEVKP